MITRRVELREARAADSAVVTSLEAGEPFDLLDITGEAGWGIAADRGLVGYLDAAALAHEAVD